MYFREIPPIQSKWKTDKIVSYSTVMQVRTDSGTYSTVARDVKLEDNSNLEENLCDRDRKCNSLFESLRGFLIIGKVIGLLPFSGIFRGKSSEEFTHRRWSLTSIFSHLIFVSLGLDTSIGILVAVRNNKHNALEIAYTAGAVMYYVWGCLLYSAFLFRGSLFLEIFSKWDRTALVFSNPDKTLRRDALLITGVMLTSAVLENGLLHMTYLTPFDSFTGSGLKFGNRMENMTLLEGYYHRGNYHLSKTIDYNGFLAALAFLNHKWVLYSWNYVDICIAVFGRAISFRFRTLHELAKEKLLNPEFERRGSGIPIQAGHEWQAVVHDFRKLCGLLTTMEAFFSPLVFGSYLSNIFYLSLHLLDGFTSQGSGFNLFHSVYAHWSFLHLITRIFTVTICCAQIHVHAHKIQNIFQECPPEFYTVEIARTDNKVTAGPPIGLSGLRCFVVTKPLILSALSVVFTLEIVFLQCMPIEERINANN